MLKMISKFIQRHQKELLHLFTAKELEIIIRQVKGITLSQADSNRLSREIRPKLRIIEKMGLINSELFNLKKGSEIKLEIEELIIQIKLSKYKHKIDKITLFGSYNNKVHDLNSDVDLSFNMPYSTHKEMNEFLLWINSLKENNFDINIYELLPNKLKKEVDNGRVLYTNK